MESPFNNCCAPTNWCGFEYDAKAEAAHYWDEDDNYIGESFMPIMQPYALDYEVLKAKYNQDLMFWIKAEYV